MYYLFEEEMVGQMIENHGIPNIDRIGLAEQLNSISDPFRGIGIQIQEGQPHQGSNAQWIQVQSTLKGQSKQQNYTEI